MYCNLDYLGQLCFGKVVVDIRLTLTFALSTVAFLLFRALASNLVQKINLGSAHVPRSFVD